MTGQPTEATPSREVRATLAVLADTIGKTLAATVDLTDAVQLLAEDNATLLRELAAARTRLTECEDNATLLRELAAARTRLTECEAALLFATDPPAGDQYPLDRAYTYMHRWIPEGDIDRVLGAHTPDI